MKTIQVPYNSFGTLYGTVRAYDTSGADIGAQNISGYGIFFVVKKNFDPFGTFVFQRSVGTGITISVGSAGSFVMTWNATHVAYPAGRYYFECLVDPTGGTVWTGTTHNMKSIGSGVWEIMSGLRYGTS